MTEPANQLDRHDEIGLKLWEAQDKFEYFILGATLAVIAYLAQTNPYAPIGKNRETFLLISLVYFALSAGCSLFRLQLSINLLSKNLGALGLFSEGKDAAVKTLLLDAKHVARTSRLIALGRSAFLMSGIAFYIGTKVVASYYCHGCMPNLPN